MTTTAIAPTSHSVIGLRLICWKQSTDGMASFSIDKQRGKVNAEWMSRPVDVRRPLVLALISIEQSLTFAYRLKRKLLSGPVLGGAYTTTCHIKIVAAR